MRIINLKIAANFLKTGKSNDTPPLLLGEGAGGEVLISFVSLSLKCTNLKFKM